MWSVRFSSLACMSEVVSILNIVKGPKALDSAICMNRSLGDVHTAGI